MFIAFSLLIIFGGIIIVAACDAAQRKSVRLTAEHRHFATAINLGASAIELGKKLGLSWSRHHIALHDQIAWVPAHAVRRGPSDMPEGATFIATPFSAKVVQDHLCKVLPEHRRPAELRGGDQA